MTIQSNTREKMSSIPSKELRAMRAEIKRLQYELDKVRGGKAMLLYLMGLGRDSVDEKDKWVLILQEKVNRAIAMLELSDDPFDVLQMLTEKVDFYEAHPTFVIGMNEGKDDVASS